MAPGNAGQWPDKPQSAWIQAITPDALTTARARLHLSPEARQELEDICTHAKRHLKTASFKGERSSFLVHLQGPSGTGKSLTASLMAPKLGLPLYRVDPGTIVSKYIGETEKNLSELFDKAESDSALLFFIGADTLFGKRTPVRDVRDRWQNSDARQLLTRIEDYPGIVVLASNARTELDEALLARLDAEMTILPPAPIVIRFWRWIRSHFKTG